jgi:hypothetical protein
VLTSSDKHLPSLCESLGYIILGFAVILSFLWIGVAASLVPQKNRDFAQSWALSIAQSWVIW